MSVRVCLYMCFCSRIEVTGWEFQYYHGRTYLISGQALGVGSPRLIFISSFLSFSTGGSISQMFWCLQGRVSLWGQDSAPRTRGSLQVPTFIGHGPSSGWFQRARLCWPFLRMLELSTHTNLICLLKGSGMKFRKVYGIN